MPVSKKRKKKRTKSYSGPPIIKAETATKKRKISRQQILIYVFSALVILSLAVSFIISGLGGNATPQPSTGDQEVLSTPAPDPENDQSDAPAETDTDTEAAGSEN